MNSSRKQSRRYVAASSTANAHESFASETPGPLFAGTEQMLPGSLDDAPVVRGVLIDSIKKCGRSREQITETMTYVLGREITVRMLNAFTAESREDHRWPSEFDRAFCYATGDDRLLRCRVERAGLHVITSEEADLLELGRQYLIRQRSSETIALIEKRLAGVEL